MKHPNLSEQQLSELKQRLLEKRKVIKHQLSILDSEDSFKDPDRTQGNSEEQDEALEAVTHLENDLKEDNLEETLELVEKALANMETGDYGICEKGEPISVERLMVFPEADTCIEHGN